MIQNFCVDRWSKLTNYSEFWTQKDIIKTFDVGFVEILKEFERKKQKNNPTQEKVSVRHLLLF